MSYKYKKRDEKSKLYDEKYGDIPRDHDERLAWMYDQMSMNEKKTDKIIDKRDDMIQTLNTKEFKIVLYEEPEGSPRPRFRLINRKNIANMAMSANNFIHVYSPSGADDNRYMRRLVGDELLELNELIYTPCIINIDVFMKTLSVFNDADKYLCEIGLIRPITKPDWDNIGKKYSDMFNSNIWLDDTLVISGSVNRYYSMLPRVEINIQYMNMLYNKHQTKSMSKNKLMQGRDIKYYGGNNND